jgi:hypothetical protein
MMHVSMSTETAGCDSAFDIEYDQVETTEHSAAAIDVICAIEGRSISSPTGPLPIAFPNASSPPLPKQK